MNPDDSRSETWHKAFSYRVDTNPKRSLETYFKNFKVTRYRSCGSDRERDVSIDSGISTERDASIGSGISIEGDVSIDSGISVEMDIDAKFSFGF